MLQSWSPGWDLAIRSNTTNSSDDNNDSDSSNNIDNDNNARSYGDIIDYNRNNNDDLVSYDLHNGISSHSFFTCSVSKHIMLFLFTEM